MFRNILQKVEIYLILIYKRILSPLLKIFFKGGCRYTPNCSEYAIQAVKKYGPYRGLALSLLRFVRCNPFSQRPRMYPLE